MVTIYFILASVFSAVSILSMIPNQHWMFRIWEFGRIQLFYLLLLTFSLGIYLFESDSLSLWTFQFTLLGLMLYNFFKLRPYLSLINSQTKYSGTSNVKPISILSFNVLQFSKEYDKFLDLIQKTDPDIVFTMESNLKWEKAMSPLERKYQHSIKIALENTYGMHFYTRLHVISKKINYFIAEDIPSVEVHLRTAEGNSFHFIGVHPPPPSPTEEDTSKERDGELLSVAKRVIGLKEPVIVVGDFNAVAWSRTSVLFRKKSELIDARMGRGFVSTYHAKYRLLRFPIDQMYHSPSIFVENFTALKNIGSDHLPLFCDFIIDVDAIMQRDGIETTDSIENDEVENLIDKGKLENGERPPIASG